MKSLHFKVSEKSDPTELGDNKWNWTRWKNMIGSVKGTDEEKIHYLRMLLCHIITEWFPSKSAWHTGRLFGLTLRLQHLHNNLRVVLKFLLPHILPSLSFSINSRSLTLGTGTLSYLLENLECFPGSQSLTWLMHLPHFLSQRLSKGNNQTVTFSKAFPFVLDTFVMPQTFRPKRA